MSLLSVVWPALLAAAPYLGSGLDSVLRGGRVPWPRWVPFAVFGGGVLIAGVLGRLWAAQLDGADQLDALSGLALGFTGLLLCVFGTRRWYRRRRGIVVVRWRRRRGFYF